MLGKLFDLEPKAEGTWGNECSGSSQYFSRTLVW